MQGLADGYFVLPYTIGESLSDKLGTEPVSTDDPVFKEAEKDVNDRTQRFLNIGGTKSPDYYHRELGKVVWEHIGMGRNEAGLTACISEIKAIREAFWKDVKVLGNGDSLNSSLEKVGRVADFMELGELMARDALDRSESCGGHFREESQTEEGEALRNDDDFKHVSAWEWQGRCRHPTDQAQRRAGV